jgi:2-succinyl-5-enolpyruvyl-6-hydroxy-3-cyclohexene-1-carboxylate synthase
MYTDNKSAQVVLSLLKKYGVKKIVVSPGTANVPISRSVQVDPWFEVYSVVDERGAAYFAGGLAYQTGEPVVVSCTGATASRNYMPGLTEAFYRNLPVIALTSQYHTSDYDNLVPQITDRTVSQNDIKKISVHLPVVKDDEDWERCVISVNKAFIAATTRGGGPVHINMLVRDMNFTTPKLPDVRKIDYSTSDDLIKNIVKLNNELNSKKIAIFIGAHRKFDKQEEKALENFAIKYGAPVIVDHTSSYRGKNSILLAHISHLKRSLNRPDLIIDIGSITGEYSANWLAGIETWRLSEDGKIHDRFHNQTKLFDCLEESFFVAFKKTTPKSDTNYYKELADEVKNIALPDVPLSNTMISRELSRRLPKHSNLHLGILNSLRNMNFFELDKTIDTSSNVGGFGIDGALSTLIGQSTADRKKLTFGLVGDLAAFYDMNALGIRHISNNVRILLVNNSGGVEFRLNSTIEDQWAEETNEYISATGHNGSMEGWAKTNNFHYMSAKSKKELLKKIDEFCVPDLMKFSRPVLFEVFTEIADEQQGLIMMREANNPKEPISVALTENDPQLPVQFRAKTKLKSGLKKIAPESAKKLYRGIRKNGK